MPNSGTSQQTILNTPTITLSSSAAALLPQDRIISTGLVTKVSSSAVLSTVVQTASIGSNSGVVNLVTSPIGHMTSNVSIVTTPNPVLKGPGLTCASTAHSQPVLAAGILTVPTISSSIASKFSSEASNVKSVSGPDPSASNVLMSPGPANHAHVPHGAAVAAQLSNRSSVSTVAAAQRTTIQNRNVQLTNSSWPRTTTTVGTTGSVVPLHTPKFTRLPSHAVTVSQASGLIRQTSITRVVNTCVNNAISNSSVSRVTSANVQSLSGGVRGTTARAVLTPARSPTGAPRPGGGTLAPPIRLAQSPAPQRVASPYSVSSIQRPTQPLALTSAPVRARPAQGARFATVTPGQMQPSINIQQQIRTLSSNSGTPAPSSLMVSSSTTSLAPGGPGARPQSNPGFSTIVRPVTQCGSRPASTGSSLQNISVSCTNTAGSTFPSSGLRPVTGVQAPVVRPTAASGVVRSLAGSPATIIRADSLRSPHQVFETKPQASSLVTASRPHIMQQQFFHMKVPPSTGSGSASSVTCNPSTALRIPSTPSIAVRISSTPAGAAPAAGGSTAVTVAQVAAGRSRPPIEQSLVVSGGKPSSAAVSTSAGAVAAVLPPGTTITPAVLSPSIRPEPPPPPPTVSLHKAPVSSVTTQYTVTSQPQFFIDKKPAITTGTCRLGGVTRRIGSDSAAPNLLQQQTNLSSPTTKSMGSSPRPSILRKRSDYDGSSCGKSVCRNLTGALSSSSSGGGGGSSSPPSPPLRAESSGGGNSGGSTGSATLSANSSPGLLIEEGEPGDESRQALLTAQTALSDGISPRKKPRKQQLTGNELQDVQPQQRPSNEEDEDKPRPSKRIKKEPEAAAEAYGGSWVGESSTLKPRFVGGSSGVFRCTAKVSGTTFGPRESGSHRVPSGLLTSSSPSNRFNNENNANFVNNVNNFDECDASGSGSLNVCNSTGKHKVKVESCDRVDGRAEHRARVEDKLHRTLKQEQEERSRVRPRRYMSLLDFYRPTEKLRLNHFESHNDVIAKPERVKVPVFADIKKKKQSLQRLDGWKVVHVSGQVKDMLAIEDEVTERLNTLLSVFETQNAASSKIKEVEQVCELIKANVQRSRIMREQLSEAVASVRKHIAHKHRVAQIMLKYSSKRQLRKKDKK